MKSHLLSGNADLERYIRCGQKPVLTVDPGDLNDSTHWQGLEWFVGYRYPSNRNDEFPAKVIVAGQPPQTRIIDPLLKSDGYNSVVRDTLHFFAVFVLFPLLWSASVQQAGAQNKRLRPAVERDLRKFLQDFNGGEAPTEKDVEEEFNQCTFSTVDLGSLGEGIVVEPQLGKGRNAGMLNVYVPSGAGYRRVVEASGIGPYTLPTLGAPPDLVIGWTMGICETEWYRYHYSTGQYIINACAQETRDSDAKPGEYCAIQTCVGRDKYALFDPPENKIPPNQLQRPDGPTCAPLVSLDPQQTAADSAQPTPGNQVQFLVVPRIVGDCQPTAFEGISTWTTSDPVNTAVTSRGVVTCLHPTPAAATITLTGTFHKPFVASASISCR